MANASARLVASDNNNNKPKPERVGPDYFGYYSSEIINLLTHRDDALPVATATQTSSEPPQSKQRGEGKKNSMINHHNDDFSASLFNDAFGAAAGLSDYKKERLRLLLRQSVTVLSSEVDEVVDPVFSTYHLQSRLKSKIRSLNHTASDDQVQTPCKKLKGNDSHLGSDIGLKENGEVNDDFQFLLENDSVKVEEIVKKYSDELSGTLVYMEQQLESLLDAVMLKCRPMTLGEKQKLQRLIQKLPSRNLDRVVEILCRSRPEEEQSCDKIFVDLEKEDNATLWRLYHYVEAVEKAKILSSCLEAQFV